MPFLRFDPEVSVIPIQVKIWNGPKFFKLSLILDTGATFCMLPPETIDYLGLDADRSKSVIVSTVTQTESLPLIIVPKISFLDLEIENVACLVKYLPEKDLGEGLLGLSFLRKVELNLSFKRGLLEIKK